MLQLASTGNEMFCAPCQKFLDENPIGALIQRDDEGKYMLCPQCRSSIYKANDSCKVGMTLFTFTNPAAESQGVPVRTEPVPREPVPTEPVPTEPVSCQPLHEAVTKPSRWCCPRCCSAVFALPRVYEGGEEPEDWWWCRACQREKRTAQSVDKKEHKRRAQESSKGGQKRAKISVDRYPRLDRWFGTAPRN